MFRVPQEIPVSADHNHAGEDCRQSHRWGVSSQSAARLIPYILMRGQFQGPPTACLAQPGSLMQHRRARQEHRRRGHCTRIKVRIACGSTEVSCPAVAPVPFSSEHLPFPSCQNQGKEKFEIIYSWAFLLGNPEMARVCR